MCHVDRNRVVASRRESASNRPPGGVSCPRCRLVRLALLGIAEKIGPLCCSSSDARVLPTTYEEWLRKAEGLAAQITTKGGIAEKVIIDPSEFEKWCSGHGLRPDAEARMRFGNEFVARKYLKQS